MMNHKKISHLLDWLGIGMMLACILTAYISNVYYHKIITYAPMITCLMLLLFFCAHIDVKKVMKEKETEFCLLVGGIGLSGLNLMLSHSGYGAIFNIANLLLILYLANKVKLKPSMYYTVGITCLLVLGSWIVHPDEAYNTNMAAMVIFAVGSFGLVAVTAGCRKYSKVWIGKAIVLAVVLGFMTPLVWHLRARGVLLGIATFLVLYYIFPISLWKNKRLYMGCVWLVMIVSLAFPLLYVWMWKGGVQVPVSFFEKSFFSGRDTIWNQFFTAFLREPMTGIGSDFAVKMPELVTTEAHNAFIHILTVHGSIMFALVVYFIYKRMKDIGELAAGSAVTRQCICVIVSMMLISIFENYFIMPFFNNLWLLLFWVGMENHSNL